YSDHYPRSLHDALPIFGKTPAGRDFNEGVFLIRVLVRDVAYKKQYKHVVLVLRRVHAAAQFVAALPDRAIQLGFLDGHVSYFNRSEEHTSELQSRSDLV